jgi:hypothetical protein
MSLLLLGAIALAQPSLPAVNATPKSLVPLFVTPLFAAPPTPPPVDVPGRYVPLAATDGIAPLAATDRVDPERDRKRGEYERRASLRTLHRAFGITTWISMGFTNFLGTSRYANVIGFGTPNCESGTPIFGRTWGCGDGLKYQHLISGMFTTASYATTRTIAALMPDPYNAGDGDSTAAKKLRVHRALSWVHLVGMIAMPILGLATSATDDEGARKTLATVHLVTGYTTFAAVSTAAVIMIF